MAALIGILLDVSGSMKSSIGGPVQQRGGSWARSIFRVLDQLVKHDVSSENKVFALGVGANGQPQVFDFFLTVEISSMQSVRTKSEMLKDIVGILERNGAKYIRDWASIDMLENSVSENEMMFLLAMLRNNRDNFTRKFVRECLPIECRQQSSSLRASVAENRDVLYFIPVIGWVAHAYIDHNAKQSTQESIREAVDKGMEIIMQGAVLDVHKASEILHGCVGEESLSEDKVDRLMKDVEPFIYGGTPMISALHEAEKLMYKRKYKDYKKILFVLSDGMPSDGETPPYLSHLKMHVVSCYITDSDIQYPKRLYSRKCQDWGEGEDFMFELSSSVTTQDLPRTIFVKRDWTIDIEDNRTKLFLQVNHPDLIQEVCDFAKKVVCSHDTLSDLLASIDLDLYINKANQDFKAKEQEDGTCYANATAAVLHLAMNRIVGRAGGYPDFFDLREEFIAKYGVYGADTYEVLQEVCPKYRLRCEIASPLKALTAVTEKRPVIARFSLTDSEWETFSKFYEENPAGILSKKDLDIAQRPKKSLTGGHAVVLTSFNSKGLTLMNSKGSDWGNNGFFSVENADVLGMKFVDVYWTLNNLKQSEIEAYKREGPRISQKLISSLKGLQQATYNCPKCHQESLVREFTGQLVNATCPKCQQVFDTNSEDAHDLVLNMYLTSLNA